MSDSSEYLTFWDHLDELRSRLIKMLIAIAVMTVAAFLMKEQLFDVILAPRNSDFLSYRLLGVPAFTLHLINTGLTEQFMVHMRTAMYVGVLAASPYIIYELFRFVSPGLYEKDGLSDVYHRNNSELFPDIPADRSLPRNLSSQY